MNSSLRAFQRAEDDHRTLPLRLHRGSKTQNGRFPSKIALRLKKVCYKVSLCEPKMNIVRCPQTQCVENLNNKLR